MEFTEQYISLSDLKKVSGIGDKTIERIKFQIDKISESKNILEDVLQIQPPYNLKVPLNDVYCGESVEFMRKNIPDKSIDMALTSPLYDNLRDYNGYEFNYETMLSEIYRVLTDSGVCVWVVGDATMNGNETGTSFKIGDRVVPHSKSIGVNKSTKGGAIQSSVWKTASKINQPFLYVNRVGKNKVLLSDEKTRLADGDYFLKKDIVLYKNKSKVKRVIYSNLVTVVFLEDGSKGMARCDPSDVYDREFGLKIATARLIIS